MVIIMPFMMQGTLLQYVRKNKSDLFETESSNFEKVGKDISLYTFYPPLPPSLSLSLVCVCVSLCVCVCVYI